MVKILSYNLYYKTMSTNPVYKLCNQIITSHNIKYNICLENLSSFVEKNGPYDFVGFQEATNWKIIKKITPTLKEMESIYHKPGADMMVTFYSIKYKLDDNENIIRGWMEDKDRPFLILFFQNRLCVINIHAGHHGDIYKFGNYLQDHLSGLSKEYMRKIFTYDIVMMGDFNDELDGNKEFVISLRNGKKTFSRTLFGINRSASCCDTKLRGIVKFSFDHILSTFPEENNHSAVTRVPMASDHVPIISIITKNVGYDFDGVLHIDVLESDEMGQRNPIGMHGPYRVFRRMVDNVVQDLSEGNGVFIVTSRTGTKNNHRVVWKHLEKAGLGPFLDRISVLFTNGKDKAIFVGKYKINTFYDDSCVKIDELYVARKNGWLPYLTNLYFVIPEEDDWVLVDDRNIRNVCGL